MIFIEMKCLNLREYMTFFKAKEVEKCHFQEGDILVHAVTRGAAWII